ncbi:ABC transporter permease [Geodermatophilus obscurus]|uniref:ABC-2 family transporter protein n=1 Tax=Geodermatophilus obscurus (strain ATCC 25078 / DSM 43160 / JCM 3152 / CCUG 61914 / KCC A-0152 / KCTC 9177 / NBRC 13315 / NRRL B-3577 / G-20) TaxID=526225 RepID=D2SEZ6_GEOOG|nr:ABC transporter permease [Geodermatophilus obscurus]ADB74686.1 hypothetical protein Gobs_1993 [Geodermatophilus obscurus DSM 43160]
MSTILTAEPTSPTAVRVPVRVRPVTPARVLNSEWIKMRSLRSTTLTLIAAVVTMVAAGWVFGWAATRQWSTMPPEALASFSPIDTTLAGYNLAQLAVGVLGVLLVTGEYATGMVRATFGAVPRRLPVLWAKATLYAGVTFALMLAAGFAAFLGGQLLGTHGTDLLAPGALRALVGVAGYLTLIRVFAVALGFLVRSPQAASRRCSGCCSCCPGWGCCSPRVGRTSCRTYPATPAPRWSARTSPMATCRPRQASWCCWPGSPGRWPAPACSSGGATPNRRCRNPAAVVALTSTDRNSEPSPA